MEKYHNIKETKKIGAHIEKLRKDRDLSIGDIAQMTGFANSSISSVENGGETDTSHLIEIAKAIGVHPSELFDITFEIKPRFKLDPNRQKRNLLTSRIKKIYENTNFFDKPRFVSDVASYMEEIYKIKSGSASTSISIVLKRLSDKGYLKYSKAGRRNQYVKNKKR